MSEFMPQRVCIALDGGLNVVGPFPPDEPLATEYVRADLHEALQAEVGRLLGLFAAVETEIASAETWNPRIAKICRAALTDPAAQEDEELRDWRGNPV